MTQRRIHLILAGICLLGLLLRLYRLDYQSVWSDEGYSLTIAHQSPGAITQTAASEVHPPFYLLLLHWVFQVFGYGSVQARFLSLIFGVLAIPVIYLLGVKLFDSATGLLSAFLLAVSELGIVYSQEARNYEMVLFLSVAASWLFVRAWLDRDRWAWIGFVLVTVLLAYTHYYGVLIPATLVGFAILRHRQCPIPARWWIFGAIFCVVAYSPWLLAGLEILGRLQRGAPAEAQSSRDVHWYSAIAALNWFNNGKISGIHENSPLWTYVAGFALFCVPALLAWRTPAGEPQVAESGLSRRDRLLLLVLLTVVPTAAIFLATILTRIYNIRFISFCVFPYYVLVAHGLFRIRSARLRFATVGLLAIYSLVALRAVYFIPFKEDNRGAITYFAAKYHPGECTVFIPPVGRFRPVYWTVFYPDRTQPRAWSFAEISSRPDDCPRAWVVWDQTWWANVRWRAEIQSGIQALEQTHTVAETKRFYGAEVRLYTRQQR